MPPEPGTSVAERKFTVDPLILARVAPFGLYMAFIGINEGLNFLIAQGFFSLAPTTFLFLYIPRIVAVVAVLWYFRGDFPELRWNDLRRWAPTTFSILAGFAVFVLWIQMTWPFAVFGSLNGYAPMDIQDKALRMTFIAFRLIGAALVVPIMEELFWRSFVVRYIIRADFDKVPIGVFTITSFCLSAVLFGMEHNLWLAGIMAGVVYNFVLYRTKSIAQCVLAHAVTNGALGVYVLITHTWHFW
jgi:CAAX prenyl protease-like protein